MTTQLSTSLMPSDQWSLISDHGRDDCELPPYRRKNSSPEYDDVNRSSNRRHITFDNTITHPTRQPPPYGEVDSNPMPNCTRRTFIRSSIRPYWEPRRRSSARSEATSDSSHSSRSSSPRGSESQPSVRPKTPQNWNVGIYQGAPFVGGSKSIWDEILSDYTWGFRRSRSPGSSKRKVGSIRKLIPPDHPVYDMPSDQQARLRSRGIDPVLAAEMKAAGMPTPF